MNRVTVSMSAAIVLASLASGPAEAQRSFRVLSAGHHGPVGTIGPRHRVVDRGQMLEPVRTFGAKPKGALKKGQTRAQLMYTVGHINGEALHRPLDMTLKRGFVGGAHPNFLWNPQPRPSRFGRIR
jgi:hypothetical protein